MKTGIRIKNILEKLREMFPLREAGALRFE